MNSRPSAPFSLWLATGLTSLTFNGHQLANAGFAGDVQALWSTVRDALKWWNINVTTEQPTGTNWVGIGFAPSFGYPGGGCANVGAWQAGGIQAMVFTDVNQNNPLYCGLNAAHEAGHVLGNFADMWMNGTYAPGFWMGFPVGNPPLWTPEQRGVLDQRFGPVADLNFDGVVNMSDAQVLRSGGGYTAAEAVAVARGFQERK